MKYPPTRDHHVSGQHPDWLTPVAKRPPMAVRRRTPDQQDNHVALIFCAGMAWGVLCSILAVQAAHAAGWM